MTKDARIFITGGTGFFGSYILRHLLQQGYTQLWAMKRPNSRTGLVATIYDKINWVEADLFDYDILLESLKEIDVVIHSAAMISFVKRDLKEMLKVNIDGTTNMLNASLEGRVSKFLFVSSIAAFGRTADEPVVTEASQFQNTALDTGYGFDQASLPNARFGALKAKAFRSPLLIRP